MDSKRITSFVILCIMSVSWMCAMFGFSASNAEESTVQSHGVVEVILRVFVPGYDDMSEEEQESLINRYDKPVRKTAHFTAYALLSVLLYFAAGSLKWLPSGIAPPIFVSLPVCVIFALTDEYHQTFVDGRAGRFSDVVIDSFGAIFGTAVAVAVVLMYVKNKSKSKDEGMVAKDT